MCISYSDRHLSTNQCACDANEILLSRGVLSVPTKQAPRVWAQKLRKSLIDLGFERIESDQCIYIKASQDSFILIGIYVDDILLAARNHQEAEEVPKMLGNDYKMTNLGSAKRFLGVDIIQNPKHGSIFIHQESYLNTLLKKFGMDQCTPKMTPLPTGLDLDPENAGTLLETDDKARYHSAVGGIMYAATHTRPDLAYAASLLSRFVAQPQKGHDRALQHVLRYIKGHTRYGIHYSNVRHNLYGYTDSEHGGTVHKEGRRSTSGYIFGWQTVQSPGLRRVKLPSLHQQLRLNI